MHVVLFYFSLNICINPRVAVDFEISLNSWNTSKPEMAAWSLLQTRLYLSKHFRNCSFVVQGVIRFSTTPYHTRKPPNSRWWFHDYLTQPPMQFLRSHGSHDNSIIFLTSNDPSASTGVRGDTRIVFTTLQLRTFSTLRIRVRAHLHLIFLTLFNV